MNTSISRGTLQWFQRIAITAITIALPCRSFAANVVIPNKYSAMEGPSADDGALGSGEFYGNLSQRLQQVFGLSMLEEINVGDAITGITFRLDGGYALVDMPPQTVENYEVRLSASRHEPFFLSTEFAENRGSDEIIVRSGPLTIGSGDFTAGSAPNRFGPMIPFTLPYIYKGGPLLLEIAHDEFPQGGTIDAEFYSPSPVDAQAIFGISYLATQSVPANSHGAIIVEFQINSIPEPATAILTILAAFQVSLIVPRKRYAYVLI